MTVKMQPIYNCAYMTTAYACLDKLAKLGTMLMVCFTSQTHAQQDFMGVNSINAGQAVMREDMQLQILSTCLPVTMRICFYHGHSYAIICF